MDLAALHAAAHGIRGVIVQVRVAQPENPGAAAGHDGLDVALGSFLERWHGGTQVLTADARVLADHLDADERACRAAEEAGARSFGSVLDGPGPDPAPG